jgi:hypothetical protein
LLGNNLTTSIEPQSTPNRSTDLLTASTEKDGLNGYLTVGIAATYILNKMQIVDQQNAGSKLGSTTLLRPDNVWYPALSKGLSALFCLLGLCSPLLSFFFWHSGIDNQQHVAMTHGSSEIGLQ